MRHLKDSVKLSKTTSHRRAMIRNMVTSLILHERIETTLAKARVIRREAEHMVTLGKNGGLHARRQAASFLFDPTAVQKLFNGLSTRFKARQGGYTRIYKLGFRRGDGADMAVLEYLDRPAKGEAKPGEKKATLKAAPKKTVEKKEAVPLQRKTKSAAPKIEKKGKAPAKVGLLGRLRGRSNKEG